MTPLHILLRDPDGYPRGIIEGTRDPSGELRREGCRRRRLSDERTVDRSSRTTHERTIE